MSEQLHRYDLERQRDEALAENERIVLILSASEAHVVRLAERIATLESALAEASKCPNCDGAGCGYCWEPK